MSANGGYTLGKGYSASVRLNFQHYLWKEQLGYLIHPRIPQDQDQEGGLRIADVGTGTGVWLLDIAKKLPSAQCHGFDIDTSHAPGPKWLPPNMLVEKFDAFADEIPSELIGVYDVVHVAIFVLVVRNNDPGKMVRNLFRMLKPGGWIMWNELDFLHRRIVKSDPSLPTPHLFALLQFMKIWEDSLGPKGWIESLPDIFSRYGMEESRLERVRMPEAYAKYDNDKSLSTFEDFSHAVLDTREKGEGALLRELVDRAHEECYQIDCCTQVDMIVATAKKPG